MSITLSAIVSKIINEKYLISNEEALYLYKNTSTTELCNSANKIRQSCCSKNSNICSIINAKQGGCSENCHYCAQSAHWHTSCTPLKMVTPQKASELSLHAL
ncbi:MAG: biotin synthase BioB, partial [Treponema sp.]